MFSFLPTLWTKFFQFCLNLRHETMIRHYCTVQFFIFLLLLDCIQTLPSSNNHSKFFNHDSSYNLEKNKKGGCHFWKSNRAPYCSWTKSTMKTKLWEHKAMHLKIIFFENFLTSAGNFGPYGPPILDHYFWKNGNFHKNHHIFCIGLKKPKNFFFSERPSQCANNM